MNVLLVTTTYPTPTRPRQGAFNHVLVEALRARHDVRVIAPIPWAQSFRQKVDATERRRTLHPIYYYPPKVLRAHYHRFYWSSIGSSLKRLERDFLPDVVMGYWLHPDGAAAILAAKRYGVPSVVMSGGTDLRLLPNKARRRSEIARVLEECDRLIVFSRDLSAHARRLGVEADKVDVVYRGVSRDCFCSMDKAESRAACGVARDSVVILWAGRLEHVKNPVLLLHAAVQWKREWGKQLCVIVAGDGPMLRRLIRLRRQLDLQDVVFFAGNLTQSELARCFTAADLTVLTSHSEGLPNVLLESIVCGTPFVATEVGGVAEIASPGLDRLVPAGDVNAMANAVIQHVRAGPTGDRAFIPTDLAGMADQLDVSITRAAGGALAVATKATQGLAQKPRTAAFQQALQEMVRR